MLNKFFKIKNIAPSLSLAVLSSAAFAGSAAEISTGNFAVTDTGKERGYAIDGRAMLVKNTLGSTEVYAQVLGLTPGASYGSHLHNLPCDLGGGGHYKFDPTIADVIRENEMWLPLTADSNGAALSEDQANHYARPEAQSIVVHDHTDGARIACADLTAPQNGTKLYKGDFVSFNSGSEMDLGINGYAQMVRSGNSTYVTVRVEGVVENQTYPAHVHNLPCDVSNGGGHYKIDPTVDTVIAENEIWPLVSSDENGVGTGSASALHIARPEAQSVVVHAPDGTRLACATLTNDDVETVKTQGEFLTTATGLARGYALDGTVTMLRKPQGHTFVFSKVKGLASGTSYSAHVHNLPCRLGGGGHYKLDDEIAEVIKENELWPILNGSYGSARGFDYALNHIARPEAQSVVIHDPEDGARIGCADLN